MTTNTNKTSPTIIVGYDGSECASAAIAALCRAGLPARARAVVTTLAEVHVPVVLAPAVGDFHNGATTAGEVMEHLMERASKDAARIAAEGAERLRTVFPRWDVDTSSRFASATHGLIEEAERHGASMIVVGSHGRSAVGRFLIGSVSQFVLNHATCSVRIARPHPKRPGDAVRLLVGIDGSEDSMAAVDELRRRRWPPGSQVRLLLCADYKLWAYLIAAEPEEAPLLQEIRRERGFVSPMDVVDRAAEQLRENGLIVTPGVREGDPKRVLLLEAHEWGADCIHLGAKGHGPLQRFFIGSVSASVAARAACSVEVTRRPVPSRVL